MADELFELKNYFYLGNYANAITEGDTVHLDDDDAKTQRDIILRRIALDQGKYADIISSTDNTSPETLPAYKVLKLLAQYLDPATSFTASDLSSSVSALAHDTHSDVLPTSPSFSVLLAASYLHASEHDSALKIVNKPCPPSDKLELLSIGVQVLLAMDRCDVASREVEKMKSMDEDSTLTQLAQAFVHVHSGDKEALQEALYIYQDLLERHGATDAILNGMAAAHFALGKTDQADKVLSEALTKNPNCEVSLVNVIASAPARNKPIQLVARYFQQLVAVAPAGTWLAQYRKKEAELDDIAKTMEADTAAAVIA